MCSSGLYGVTNLIRVRSQTVERVSYVQTDSIKPVVLIGYSAGCCVNIVDMYYMNVRRPDSSTRIKIQVPTDMIENLCRIVQKSGAVEIHWNFDYVSIKYSRNHNSHIYITIVIFQNSRHYHLQNWDRSCAESPISRRVPHKLNIW